MSETTPASRNRTHTDPMHGTAALSRRSLWLHRGLPVVPVLIPLIISLWSGLIGIDFGHQWDEGPNISHVSDAIYTNVLLPRYYDYPSVMFWLIVFSVATRVPFAVQSPDFSLLQYSESQEFLLQTRVLFLVVSSLAVLWVYLLVLVWRKDWRQALAAASILAFSWEFNYHSRWVTPDAIMAQFAALTALFVVLSFFHPSRRWTWLKLAAVGAGLTTGCKYPAGLIVVPVLLAHYFTWDRESILRGLIIPGLELAFIMGLAYLISTPGTVLDPVVFVTSLQIQFRLYAGPHGGNTVVAGADHLVRILTYLSSIVFSPYFPLALIFFALALLGAYVAFRENRRLAIVLLTFPVLYVLYFSRFQIMVVRNYIVMVPFFAVLAGRGVGYLLERLPGQLARRAAALAVAALLIANAVWLFYAAGTIPDRGSSRFTHDLAEYLAAHPQTTYYLSDRVAQILHSTAPGEYGNVLTSPDDADYVALLVREEGHGCLMANRAWQIDRWFGPFEANLNYYPNWGGEDHIALIRANRFRELASCLEANW